LSTELAGIEACDLTDTYEGHRIQDQCSWYAKKSEFSEGSCVPPVEPTMLRSGFWEQWARLSLHLLHLTLG
jgi:hypothetical protein